MAGDTDFNLSDETDDESGEDGTATTTHAGDDVDDKEPEDRGDTVGAGQGEEGDPDAGAAAAGDGGDVADPDFLASLAGEEGAGKAPAMVPYARLAELSAQNQRLMGVLEGITSGRLPIQQPAAAAAAEAEPAFDLKAQLKAQNAALLEGDEDKALEIAMAIEEHRNTTIRAQARQEAMQDFEATRQKETIESVVSEAFGKYTFLDTNDENFNAEALDEVMMFRNHYFSKGDTLPVALQKAIDKVCPQYVADDETPDEKAAREAAALKATASGARDPAKIIRNAKAAASQPASLAAAGVANRETIDTNKLDLENMSDEDYDKVPEAVKAKARGDIAA